MNRLRGLLPALTLLYLGLALLAAPLLTPYSRPPVDLLRDGGIILSIGAIVWLLSRRIEGQLEVLLQERALSEKYAVNSVGVISRFDMVELVKASRLRDIRMVLANREDIPMLSELLRYTKEPTGAPGRVLICNWNTDEDVISRSEQAHLATWINDARRPLGKGAELRTSKNPTSKVLVQASDRFLLLVPLTTMGELYSYVILAAWGAPAGELQREVDDLWSSAVPHDDIEH